LGQPGYPWASDSLASRLPSFVCSRFHLPYEEIRAITLPVISGYHHPIFFPEVTVQYILQMGIGLNNPLPSSLDSKYEICPRDLVDGLTTSRENTGECKKVGTTSHPSPDYLLTTTHTPLRPAGFSRLSLIQTKRSARIKSSRPRSCQVQK